MRWCNACRRSLGRRFGRLLITGRSGRGRFQGFKVSRFQGFKVSRFQGFKVSRFQGFKVLQVSSFSGFKVSKSQPEIFANKIGTVRKLGSKEDKRWADLIFKN